VPITKIVEVDNRSSGTVTLLNVENPDTTRELTVPKGERRAASIFVPWAASAGSFTNQHLQVLVDGRVRFWVWQAAAWDGDHLRFSRSGTWRSPGTRVHGVSLVQREGADRSLVVNDDCVDLEDLPAALRADLKASMPSAGFRRSPEQPSDPMREDTPSVPRLAATAFSMAGPASDARAAGRPGARFLYRDAGKRYEFRIDAAGLVVATHPDGSRTELPHAVSYHDVRIGNRFPAPPFDLLAANDTRILAKARGTSDLYVATMDDLFVHGDGEGPELAVPSMYFKLDPQAGDAARPTADLVAHLRGCFADHPAVERFPLFRIGLGLDLADMMAVRVEPRVWHLVDARPPLGTDPVLAPFVPLLQSLLDQAQTLLGDWPFLADARAALADLRRKAEQWQIDFADPDFDAFAPPSGVETYLHMRYTDGIRDLEYRSIRYYRVLGIGAGHAHWHAVYDGSTGGEVQPMRAPAAVGPFSYADLYRLVNGPLRDGDGYIDGTANFYALVQLKSDPALAAETPADEPPLPLGRGVPGAFGLLVLDEQSYFHGRWRLAHPDDHVGGGFALATALATTDGSPQRLYGWDPRRFWCPFRAGHVDARSRLATSRQVAAVTGVDRNGESEIYTINYSYSTMDHSWRRRRLPQGAEVEHFEDEAAAAAETLPEGLRGDTVFPQTVQLREDMTLVLRGTCDDVPGRWYQRYLPSDNALVPPVEALTGGPPVVPYSHPWRFMSEAAFAVADRLSHLGVYDTVDSRSQFYRLDVPAEAATALAKTSPDAAWHDDTGQLFVRALRFYWCAPLRLPHVDPYPDTLFRPEKRIPPSMFNSTTMLRLSKRGGSWIATHWDKRDDDLIPFDAREDWLGRPAVPQPPVTLVSGGQRIAVTVKDHVPTERGPVLPHVDVVWTGDPTAPLLLRAHGARDVWRLRLGAVDGGRAVVLLTVELSQLARTADGAREHRWRPPDAELPRWRRLCTDPGARQHGTTVWAEDIVGHVVLPDTLSWLDSLRAAADPVDVPLGMPTSVVVRAHDALTGRSTAGTVQVDGTEIGATDQVLQVTFRTRRVMRDDPDLGRLVAVTVPPEVTVSAPGYRSAPVPMTFRQPQLRVWAEPGTLFIGLPGTITVRAVDTVTGAAVAGRVLLGGIDVGPTGAAIPHTPGATAPTAVVTAPYYPTTRVAWPALRSPRLAVTVHPYPVPMRAAVSVTFRTTNADTGTAVDGTVLVNGVAVGRTNTTFAFTFSPTRTRVFDPELRIWTFQVTPPQVLVRANGYPDASVDLGG
jgi:hypothetical protein